jgi:hypothetical protein
MFVTRDWPPAKVLLGVSFWYFRCTLAADAVHVDDAGAKGRGTADAVHVDGIMT